MDTVLDSPAHVYRAAKRYSWCFPTRVLRPDLRTASHIPEKAAWFSDDTHLQYQKWELADNISKR